MLAHGLADGLPLDGRDPQQLPHPYLVRVAHLSIEALAIDTTQRLTVFIRDVPAENAVHPADAAAAQRASLCH